MKKLVEILISVFAVGLLLVTFSACKKNVLPSPTGISLDEENVLTWDYVDNARRYKLEIVNVDTGKTSVGNPSAPKYSLDNLDEGNYEIKIMAISGVKNLSDSDWSRVIEFHRGYKTGCLYKLIKNNTEYQIEKSGQAQGKVIIEDKYRGKPLTSIAKAAFRGNRNVEEIIIGANVTEIGENAFSNCRALKAITLPESLEIIGGGAFQSCKMLEEISIPYGVTEILDSTFAYCSSLKKATFSSNVSVIAYAAFSDCTSLEEITVPEKVKELGEYAFSNCGIENLVIGNGLETIAGNAFYKCEKLTSVTFGENGALKTIGDYAFAGCISLETINIPDGVEDIGKYCFNSSEKLETVTIPDSVNHVGAYAFEGTKLFEDALASAVNEYAAVYVGKWLIRVSDRLSYEINYLTTAAGKSTVINNAPETVITDDISSFMGGASEQILLVIKDGTIGIGDNVFINATQLKTVSLPASLKYIGNYAFAGASTLWSLSVARNGLEIIGEYAFYKCEVFNTLDLGNSLKEIKSYAFYDCKLLDNRSDGESFLPDTLEKVGTFAFKNTKLWTRPDEYGIVYAGNWVVGYGGGNLATVSLKPGVVGVSDYAFYNSSTLTGIIGLANAKHVGRAAFYNCPKLATVTLNRELTRIEDYTFYKCSSLAIETLPSWLVSIGRSAFYECGSLTTLNLMNTRLEEIGDFAFYGCNLLADVNFGRNLVSVGEKAFYKDAELKKIVLPDTTVSIGLRAFYKCEKVNEIKLGSSLESIGEYAFSSMPLVEEIIIPDSVKTVGNYAFYKATGVKKLTIGASVEEIGNYAFFGMEKLKYINIPENVKKIGNYAFKGLNEVKSFIVGSNIEELGIHAFYGAKQATVYTDAAENLGGWSERWNSSYRPVVWGCVLSEDKTYVVSVKINEKSFSNAYVIYETEEQNRFGGPVRAGYTFVGWATEQGGAVAYRANEITGVENGTTLYAVWEEGEEPEEGTDESSAETSTEE